MRIAIINGPNLNLLGIRQPEIYGSDGMGGCLDHLRENYPDISFSFFQSNQEGDLIDEIQRAGFEDDFLVLNAGGYTHTSVAIADAISAVTAPCIEVHISNVHARESYRRHSYISPVCVGSISGFGLNSYVLAVEACLRMKSVNR